jgi:UDP-N-acetylmuramoyl-tripeptide--D-alanyl-D-alanine ligase
MGEVGTQGPAFHDEVGRYAKDAGIERLLGVGALARHATAAFGGGGEHFDDVESVAKRACSLLMSRATVLVKGSRFMRMERIVEQLVVEENHAA